MNCRTSKILSFQDFSTVITFYHILHASFLLLVTQPTLIHAMSYSPTHHWASSVAYTQCIDSVNEVRARHPACTHLIALRRPLGEPQRHHYCPGSVSLRSTLKSTPWRISGNLISLSYPKFRGIMQVPAYLSTPSSQALKETK